MRARLRRRHNSYFFERGLRAFSKIETAREPKAKNKDVKKGVSGTTRNADACMQLNGNAIHLIGRKDFGKSISQLQTSGEAEMAFIYVAFFMLHSIIFSQLSWAASQ